MHAYVISKGPDLTEQAMNRMLDAAGRLHCSPLLDMILLTELSTGVELVRDIMAKRLPEAENARKNLPPGPPQNPDGHFTVWSMPAEDPDCERLMALH